MLLNNEKTFVMMLQEGLRNLYEFIGGCHVMACPPWEAIVNYEEILRCTWELCDPISSEPSSSKDLREPLILLKQDSSVLTPKHSTIGSTYTWELILWVIFNENLK